MLAKWTEILPVFLFRILARRCGMITVEGVLYHEALPDVLVRNKADWWTYRVRRIAEYAQKHGVQAAEAQYGPYGKEAMDAGIRQAFWHLPKEGS